MIVLHPVITNALHKIAREIDACYMVGDDVTLVTSKIKHPYTVIVTEKEVKILIGEQPIITIRNENT
jgi:hypothetical protein